MEINSEEFELVQEAWHSPSEENKWVLVEEGDWVQDGKYQEQTNIVKDSLTGKFYRYSISRSGSPFTDWYYPHQDESKHYLEEVTQQTRTITVTEWV